MNEERIKKLAEFAGILWKITERTYNHLEQDIWVYPDGTIRDEPPDFPNDLNACFKWLVPKVYDMELIKRNRFEGEWQTAYMARVRLACKPWIDAITHKEPALALCLAIEKLIKKEE